MNSNSMQLSGYPTFACEGVKNRHAPSQEEQSVVKAGTPRIPGVAALLPGAH